MSASPSPPSVHVAGFYDTDAFLTDRVASFVTEGLTAGEQVIVLATASHWTAISARSSASGLEFRRAVTEGRLLLLEATDVLDGLTVEGRVSVEGFRTALARFVTPGVQHEVLRQHTHLVSASGEQATLH